MQQVKGGTPKMLHPKNECIAARAFAALLLDYEYPGDNYCPPYASGRILIEDLCREHVSARSRAELIDYFNNWRDNRMTAPADFAELIRAATLAAIARTEARSPAAAAYARHELEDVTQAAALEALERLAAGAQGDPAQICARAANVAITRAYRARRRAPAAEYRPEDDASPAPEIDDAGELVRIIAEAMPAAYRDDAPRVLALTAAGYTRDETARALDCSARRVKRIIAAARDAAERTVYNE